MSSAVAWTLFDRYAAFIKFLAQTLGHGCTRHTTRADLAILSLFHRRLQRTLRRFKRFAEAENPAALNPKPRRRRQPDQPQPERRERPQDPLLARSTPRQFGWLRRMIPELPATCGIAAATGMLLQLLQDPELEALLKTCPTLARSLRPLCHALGIRKVYNRPLPFPPPKPRTPTRLPPNPPPALRSAAKPKAPPLAFPPNSAKIAF